MFNHRHRYWFIVCLSLYTFLNTLLCDVYHYFQIQIVWYLAFLTVLTVTLFTWEGNRLIQGMIRRYFPPSKNKFRFLIAFFIAGNIIAVIAAVIPVTVVGQVWLGRSWGDNLNPIKLNIIYAGLVNLFFHLLNAISFYFQEYKNQWKITEELRRSSSQAQVQLVRSQINPHFLFNNLNVLSSMVLKDNSEANRFIEEFSKVYRYVLNNQDKELVEIQSELEFIKPYLFLLGKRFDKGLIVEINIPEANLNHYVIPIALQMLIENAIKHNVVSKNRPLHIDIHTNDNETLVVRNNLQLRQTLQPSTYIGLKNIRKRYELICGREVIITQTDQYFEVTLPLLSLN